MACPVQRAHVLVREISQHLVRQTEIGQLLPDFNFAVSSSGAASSRGWLTNTQAASTSSRQPPR